MWFKYAYTTDSHGRPAAVRWSSSRRKWVPVDRHKADALRAEGLAEFIGYR